MNLDEQPRIQLSREKADRSVQQPLVGSAMELRIIAFGSNLFDIGYIDTPVSIIQMNPKACSIWIRSNQCAMDRRNLEPLENVRKARSKRLNLPCFIGSFYLHQSIKRTRSGEVSRTIEAVQSRVKGVCSCCFGARPKRQAKNDSRTGVELGQCNWHDRPLIAPNGNLSGVPALQGSKKRKIS